MLNIDWQRYFELSKKNKEEMTQEEWEFYRWMYYVEEVRAGLDGN